MKKYIYLTGMLVLTFLLVAGCSKKKETKQDIAAYAWVEDAGEGEIPTVNPLLVRGSTITAGSSTVAPLASAVVERYREDGLAEQVTVDVIGSGAGFERWAKNGETDVSNASRKIKASEVDSARAIGREPLEFRIGTDALSVVVSKDNNFLNNVTEAELALIFGTAQKWSDINSQWPQEEILRYIPGTDSGTFDFFVEMLYEKKLETILSAENTQFSEDDNILVQGIAGSPYSVGFFGYGYYQENKDVLKLIAIEGILPSQETVDKATFDSFAKNLANGGYPIARPLFLYSSKSIMREKPQVAAYIAYFLNNVDQVINEVGYFPTDLEPSKQLWLTAMEGTF